MAPASKTLRRAQAGVGHSEAPDSRAAGAEAARAALESSGLDACELALSFATEKVDPAAFRDGIRSVVGADARIVGGYAGGVITNDFLGYEGHQCGVAVLGGGGLAVEAFMEGSIGDREHAAGRSLGSSVASGSYDGEPNVLFLWDAMKEDVATGYSLHMASRLIRGFEEAIGPSRRVAGLGTFGSLQGHPGYHWLDDRVESACATALVIHGGVRLDTTILHGCRPMGSYMEITSSDGTLIREVAGRPLIDIIQDRVGSNEDVPWEELPFFVTFGINRGDKYGEFKEDDYTIRLPMRVAENREGVLMFGDDLTEGTEIQWMRRSVDDFGYIRERVQGLLDRVGGEPFFALYIDCAARASAFCGSEREEAEVVQEALGEIPMLGMYSAVEVARVGDELQQNNMTGVLCIFSRDGIHSTTPETGAP